MSPKVKKNLKTRGFIQQAVELILMFSGWQYYDSIADSDGNLDLHAFQSLFNRSVRMFFETLKVGDAAVDSLRKIGSVLDWTPCPEIEASFKAELLNKTENDLFPVVAEAVFRFFGTFH